MPFGCGIVSARGRNVRNPWLLSPSSPHAAVRHLEELRRLRGNDLIEARLAPQADLVAGVDEVGRGAVAGPVVAAAVILPRGTRIPGLDDSKRLSEGQRRRLCSVITGKALSVGVAALSAKTIDEIGIKAATLCAMRKAVDRLLLVPRVILVDGRDPIPGLTCLQETVVKGDQRSNSIAAASIVAKVSRDHFMRLVHPRFPQYAFEENKGYGTIPHMEAVERWGLTTLHRHSFLGKAHQDQLSLFEG